MPTDPDPIPTPTPSLTHYASPKCATCGHRNPHKIAAGQDICTWHPAPGQPFDVCDCEHYVAEFDSGPSVCGVYVRLPAGFFLIVDNGVLIRTAKPNVYKCIGSLTGGR